MERNVVRCGQRRNIVYFSGMFFFHFWRGFFSSFLEVVFFFLSRLIDTCLRLLSWLFFSSSFHLSFFFLPFDLLIFFFLLQWVQSTSTQLEHSRNHCYVENTDTNSYSRLLCLPKTSSRWHSTSKWFWSDGSFLASTQRGWRWQRRSTQSSWTRDVTRQHIYVRALPERVRDTWEFHDQSHEATSFFVFFLFVRTPSWCRGSLRATCHGSHSWEINKMDMRQCHVSTTTTQRNAWFWHYALGLLG